MESKEMESSSYKKNEEFDSREFNKHIDLYRMALKFGNTALRDREMNAIYNYIYRYVYKFLWDNYSSLMHNSRYREDLIQDVWLYLIGEIKKYDYNKASITTFLKPRIQHAVSEFASLNFRKTSVYYSAAMNKIQAAILYCNQQGIEPSFDTICKYTQLAEATVMEGMEQLIKKDSVSYDVLAENGYEQIAQHITAPEEHVIAQEKTDIMNKFLKKNLDSYELEVITLLANPDDPSKSRASYREIAQKLNSNIPRIKHIVSRVTAKIKNNRELMRQFPVYLSLLEETLLMEDYLPILDDNDFINEQLDELKNDFSAQAWHNSPGSRPD